MRSTSLIIAGAVAGAALAHAPVARADDDTAKFGLVMSYSGWFAPIDASTIDGAMLAIKEINAAGGVLGKQIEAVTFDNKSEPLLGADGALEVIGKGAKAVLFPSDFDFGAPGAFVAQANDVIALSGASDPKWGVTGIGPLAYSMSNASQAQGALLAEWAFETQGWKTAYVLLDDTIVYAKSLCGSFAERWTELAGEAALLGQDTFLNGDPSIAAQISRINALPAKPEVMMFCSYAPGGPSALRQLRAAGIDTPIVTGESMDGDFWVGAVPDLSDFYVITYGSFYGDDPDPAIRDFFDRYQAEFGKRADVSYGLRGYSAVQAWARAAERAGSFDGAAVAAELDKFTDEPLAIGPTTFTPELHISTTRPITLVQAQGGTFSALGKAAAREFSLD
jgi:branched-chain amino acid transport system substrate-binding protein